MRLVLLCGLFFAPKAAAQCPQVPPAGLLPNEAVQDCGSATSEGVVCPFNCSNAFSHTGHLRCLSGTWQVDSNDPPRCIQPCYSETLITDYGQRAAFLGYLNGFWASPTEAITTTTLLSCDVLRAQSCLQTVVGITDIQEFCSRLPGATTCLKAAECCESSAATIRSSINSCADVGRVVENPCVDSTGERCSSECIPPTLGSDATAENCAALRRVPFCMRSQSCCNYWLQGLGLAELAVSCRQLGIDISDACEGYQLPYVSNEGAQVQVTCQTPRYASSSASMVQNYTCQNSSFHLTPAVPALQCLDPPCPLDPHPSGSYECTLDGQSITLTVANGVLQVPFGASCTLRCSQSHELPVPPETLQCVYVESDFTNIIYADSSLVTSTGVPRMVRRFTNSSLVPAVQQVCEAMDCPLPVLQQPVALNGNIYQAGSEIDGVLYVDCNGISHGSSCSPVCAVGFTVDPLRPSLRCDVGRFQGHVRCVQRRCAGAPVWGFGDVGSLATWPSPCANALHGETCEASCASGYMRDPSVASYICEAGEWTAPATSPCVESSCAKAPVVSNAAALQACANRPHGYECPVRCNSGYTQLGSVRCNKGSYLASGLVCIPQGIDEELQTESVDAIRAQILFVKTPRLVSLQGRVHVAANAALALEPHLEPQQLATKLAGELDVSALDLSLALSTLPSVLPSFALRAALAAAPEVSSIVILAMARFEALDLWSNISHVLVAQGSTALRGFSAALAPFATAPAAAMAALARDAGDVLQRDLDLQRFFQLLGVGSAAAIATAERQFNLTDGMDSTELQNLRLSVLGSFRDLPGAVDMADFHSKFTAALSELDLEDTLSSSTAAAAAADVAVRQVVPTAMEDVTAAAAMVTVQQMRSACVGTPASCQRETSIALLEAGREGAKVAEWRPGALAEVAAAALQASSLTMLAGALSVFGVRKEDLQRLMPSAGLEEIESAFWLSQVQDPRSFLELMQRYPVSGIDLAFRLAENGAQVTPMEGEFALSWTGDLVAAPLLRARLAGASGPDLSAAYLAALQVPPSSRSPSLLASTVSSALPSNLEAVQRCIITRAVAVALGLNATLAAKAAVLAAGFNQTTYAQSLAAATSDDIQIFAEQVRAYAGTESEAFQELSLAFAVALEKFNDVTTALLVVLQVVETPSSVAAVSFGSLSSFVASASEFVSALLTWLWSKGHAESHMLLGHFMWLLGENASGPIFQSALLNAGVYLFEADELLNASFDFSRDNSWLSLAAQRAVEEWQADGQSDLAAKVRAHLQLGSSQQSLVHAAGAAHFAAVYAGMNITATAHTVFATLGQEASPSAAFAAGFWAQKWPARPTDLLESAAATMAVVETYQQGNLEICPANETRCPNATSQHGCAERIGLTQGFSCHSHCAARSSVTWPRRCIGFVLGDHCQAQLGSCNYTITQQDLSSHSSGLCVCSSIMDSVHAAADNANRVRLPGALAFLNVVPPLTILVNSVVIGMQSDIAPDSVIWDIFEIAFITVYSLEFVLKLRIFGCKGYFCGKEAGWNWFDFTCLLLSYVDIAVYYAVVLVLRRNGQTDLSSLMLIKIFRLSRLIRLVRLVRHKLFHELKVMLFGLWAGIRVLGWAIILLFGLIYTFGVFLRNIMGESFKELETVPDAMFTLFRCFRDDCAAYDGTPFPERVRETYGGIFMVSYILMIMTVSVGVFNLIMAIFIDNVTGSQLQRRNRELADSSEKVRVMIKEHVARFLGKDVRSRRTFVTGDLDVQHSILDEQLLKDEVVIHRESFQRWLQDPEFTEALEDAYIDVSNKAHLFDIMDADMGGHLSLDELVEGLMALRGSVNKGDIINMSLKIRLLTRHVDSVLSIVQHSLDPDGDLCSEAS